MAFKTEAIVLWGRTLIGADRIYEILTPSHGRLSVIARGSLKSTSKMGGHLAPFSHVRLMIGRGRQDHLAGVATVQSYRTLRENWFDFILSSSLIELVMTLNVPGVVVGEEFRLLKRTFDAFLLKTATRRDKIFIGRIFLWKMLTLSGWKPQLEHCIACGAAFGELGAYYRSPQGFFCENHGAEGIEVQPALRDYLQRIVESQDTMELLQEPLLPFIDREWLQVSQQYYQDIVGSPIRSLAFFSYEYNGLQNVQK